MRCFLCIFAFTFTIMGCGQGEDAASIEALQAQINSLQTENQRLSDALAAASTSDANTRPAEEGTILEPAVLFVSGSAWLNLSQKRAIDRLAAQIKADYAGRRLQIQGFTDNVPIGDSLQHIYPSNWELSAQRAAAVARYLDQQHQIRPDALEISAFGFKNPATSNDTPEGRRQNRRVQVKVF